MPPRLVTGLILAFWLGSLGWLAYCEWLPWLRPDSPPPFTVELTDEAVPLSGQWSIWRDEQKIGNLFTKMTIQKDDTFELLSTLENFKLALDPIAFEVPKLTTTQRVTREGQLLAINSRLELVVVLLDHRMEMKAWLEGTVNDGKLFVKSRLEFPPFGKIDQEIEPIALQSGSLFNPMQPVAKLRVWPGQRWKTTSFDPLGEALKASLMQVISRTPGAPKIGALANFGGPESFLVRVLPDAKDLVQKDGNVSCYVVEYDSRNVSGRTWVQVSDGKVLRQEAGGLGGKLVLLREF